MAAMQRDLDGKMDQLAASQVQYVCPLSVICVLSVIYWPLWYQYV